jgi:hypothetical protein
MIMKKFMLGFILAAVLFSAIPVGAAVQEYVLTSTATKIMVDGVEFKDAKLPIMAYEGYNYLSAATFKSICEKIGAGFVWNNELKTIEIDTKVVTTSTAALTVQTNINTGGTKTMQSDSNSLPEGATMIDFQGCKAIQYSGKTFISESDLNMKFGFLYQSKGAYLKKSDNTIVHIDLTQRTSFLTINGIIYTDKDLFDL